MGAVMYGDMIPFAMSEQLFGLVAMFTCRIFLAFLFAEGATYLSNLHKSASQHTKTVAQIKDWSDLNQLPIVVKERIVRFYQTLWKKFKGVRQQQILEDLPVTLRMDVRQCLFKDIIENWEVLIGNEDQGVV
jgi:cyclic nucleotide gated channel